MLPPALAELSNWHLGRCLWNSGLSLGLEIKDFLLLTPLLRINSQSGSNGYEHFMFLGAHYSNSYTVILVNNFLFTFLLVICIYTIFIL